MSKIILNDVIDIISGGTPKTSAVEYWDHGTIGWLSINDFNNDFRKVYTSEKKITEKGLNESNTKLLKVDDIIISARGTVGVLAQIGTPMAFNQSCFGIRGKTGKVDNTYLYYALKNYVSNIRKMGHGSVFSTINLDSFKIMQIDLEDNFHVQKKIAAVLSALDDKIELNNKINTELEEMARTVYDYWFVQFDFPNAKGKPYKSSGGKMVYNEVLKREIPEGWKLKRLHEIANITMGQSPSGVSYNEAGNGMIFFQGSTDFSWRYPDERVFTTAPTRFAKQGDILLSVRAPIGMINIAMNDCCIGRGLSALNSKDSFNSFLVYQMNYFKKKFDLLNSVGTTFGSLTKDELYNLEFCYPSKEVLGRYEKMVSSLDKKIRMNTQQNKQLSALRDWLLPMLMNGQAKVTGIHSQENDLLSIAAEAVPEHNEQTQLNIPNSKKGFAKQVLAGKIVSLFKEDPHFTGIKFQKIQFLAEHIIQANLNLNYYYQAAGPYDNVFMHTIYKSLKKNKWFDYRNRKFTALEKQIKIDEYYKGYFGAAIGQLDKLFQLLRNATEAKSEIIATIYAAWNNFIIEKRSVSDKELIEAFYGWSQRKQQYTKAQILKGLQWLKENHLEPTGFGKLIKKAKGKK